MTGRLPSVVWMFIIVAAAIGLYMAKYKVQSIKDEVEVVSAQLEEQREALHVIMAEWSYLNRPERLQSLNQKYLEHTPVMGEQVGDVESLVYPNQKMADSTTMPDGLKPASLVSDVPLEDAQ